MYVNQPMNIERVLAVRCLVVVRRMFFTSNRFPHLVQKDNQAKFQSNIDTLSNFA